MSELRYLRLRKLKNALMLTLMLTLAFLTFLPLLLIIGSITLEGIKVLLKAGVSFFASLPPKPTDVSLGGIAPALIGSLISSSIALSIAASIAFISAFLTTEFPNNVISRVVEVVFRSFSGIPSLAVGMFVYSTVVVFMRTQSLIAGAVALSIVGMPYAYVYFTSALRSIPEEYREAAMSLGMSRLKALRYVYLGISRKYLLSGLLITFAKIIGDTAPLLFTIGFVTNAYFMGLDKPSNALPLLIFIYALSPYEIYHSVALGAAFILLVTLIALFEIAHAVVKEVRL